MTFQTHPPRAGIPAKFILIVASCALGLAGGAWSQSSVRPAAIGGFEGQSDVGVTPKTGSASYDAAHQEYSVTGGGANMWAGEDAFHFVWRPVAGDVTLTAEVELEGTGGNPHRKAGLMIRQGLGPSDAYADVVIHGVGLTALQYREKPGGRTLEVRAVATAPKFIRLERRGNKFIFYTGNRLRELKEAGSAEVELHDPVYAGLVVCSHDAAALETAVFRHVEVSKGSAAGNSRLTDRQ